MNKIVTFARNHIWSLLFALVVLLLMLLSNSALIKGSLGVILAIYAIVIAFIQRKHFWLFLFIGLVILQNGVQHLLSYFSNTHH